MGDSFLIPAELEMVELGYNRENNQLPQVNLVLVTPTDSGCLV